jgi:hypothetical protein
VAKPRGDLDALVVPKATAAQSVPHAPPPVPSPAKPTALSAAEGEGAGPAKALTVKLDGTTYRRLRRYCQARENATGRAPTHQEVMVAALLAFLASEEG